VLHGALRRNLGADAEINAFGRDVAAVTVAPFLVAKSKESGQLEGGNSVAYISAEADADLTKKISRLSKAGVTVRNGWSDFNPEAPEEDIGQWLATGEWPVPEPEEEEDDEDDLLALLLDDDDDDDFAAPAESKESEAVAQKNESPSETEAPESDEDDDLPVMPDPVLVDIEVKAEPVYSSRRFDSMGANDGLVDSARRKTAPTVEPENISVDDDDDDDLPLPSFTSKPSSPVAEVPTSFTFDDDDDALPAFGNDDDDEGLPAFSAAPREERTAPVNAGFSEDDELPDFSPVPLDKPITDAREVSFSDDEDDDLPSWLPRAEDAKVEAEEKVAAPSYMRPVADEDDDDELPMFRAPSAPVARESTAPPTSRRAARELPVVSDDEDDELPALKPASRESNEAPAYARREASSYARPPVDSDDEEDDLPAFNAPSFGQDAHEEEDDLPAFNAPAPVAPAAQEDDFFAEDADNDLPAFNASPVSEEVAPLRKSRRDFLKAAESLASASDSDASNDDDGDDLPEFSPVFSAAKAEEDDDLPAPVRRASVAREVERGDDLPDFAARSARAAAPEEESEEDDDESFEFAPKVKTPRYAAPVDKQPAWGLPVQRPEPVDQPEPVRREPARKVAPEKVRYEDDNPAEVIAAKAKRRREAEGYTQPEIETDVPDRVLRPAPGAVPELRKAPQRVVNQRPAAPIEEDTLDFMERSDATDDFDPDATPPFMESLQPEQRRAQSTMEKIRREYDSESVMKVRSKGSAVCYYVTGSHGGAGKTTSTWMMANTMAAALKKDPSRPVFLIEGDYENSKLAQRLNLPPEKNSGRLAELYRTLSSDRSLISKQKINMFEMTEKIIKESIYVNDHGVNIIAAPYDLTKRDGRFLRIAIQKSVEYAERQGGYVFIDADTLSNDDILDRTLAAKATHVVLVSFGDKDHVDDTHRAIHTLTTPNVKSVSGSQSNGMGVPKDRIKLFFNKTGNERFEDLQRTMRPYLTEGHLPTVQGLNDGGWIGNLTGSDFLNAVTSYASFMHRISPMEELRPYQQRKPQKVTQRSSFMKMFGSRRS
jgi:MinD-like ATPase involved in chromosome partitioning or flagellar assembly